MIEYDGIVTFLFNQFVLGMITTANNYCKNHQKIEILTIKCYKLTDTMRLVKLVKHIQTESNQNGQFS